MVDRSRENKFRGAQMPSPPAGHGGGLFATDDAAAWVLPTRTGARGAARMRRSSNETVAQRARRERRGAAWVPWSRLGRSRSPPTRLPGRADCSGRGRPWRGTPAGGGGGSRRPWHRGSLAPVSRQCRGRPAAPGLRSQLRSTRPARSPALPRRCAGGQPGQSPPRRGAEAAAAG